jgi:hypothetical protein
MKEVQQFRLTPTTKTRLEEEAQIQGVPKTSLVEMALRLFLDRCEDERVRRDQERQRLRVGGS